ncbi:uncharacterized protein DS421_14g454480 [Arachis hypogaea]|nr:uncharacterized protein DS421_14g454480 [Arachis hypogaea]
MVVEPLCRRFHRICSLWRLFYLISTRSLSSSCNHLKFQSLPCPPAPTPPSTPHPTISTPTPSIPITT